MKGLNIFISGLAAGVLSWAICPLVFAAPEPFDTTAGLATGQALLTLLAVLVVYKSGFRALPLLVIGMYVGINLYIYTAGSSEQQAWFMLGLITTLTLILAPLAGGVVCGIVRYYMGRTVRQTNEG